LQLIVVKLDEHMYFMLHVIVFLSDNMTEELLEVHKTEVLRLRNSYEQHKDMYDKLARRQKLWDEYLDLEVVFLCAMLL